MSSKASFLVGSSISHTITLSFYRFINVNPVTVPVVLLLQIISGTLKTPITIPGPAALLSVQGAESTPLCERWVTFNKFQWLTLKYAQLYAAPPIMLQFHHSLHQLGLLSHSLRSRLTKRHIGETGWNKRVANSITGNISSVVKNKAKIQQYQLNHSSLLAPKLSTLFCLANYWHRWTNTLIHCCILHLCLHIVFSSWNNTVIANGCL